MKKKQHIQTMHPVIIYYIIYLLVIIHHISIQSKAGKELWVHANGNTIFEGNKTAEIIPDIIEENEDCQDMDSERPIDFETCSEEQSQGEELSFRIKYIITTAENLEEFKRWLKLEKKKGSNQVSLVKNLL